MIPASTAREATKCGVLDLAGNVSEWVQNYHADYPSERQVNPTGPSSGESRAMRGGSWGIERAGARGATRKVSIQTPKISIGDFDVFSLTHRDLDERGRRPNHSLEPTWLSGAVGRLLEPAGGLVGD